MSVNAEAKVEKTSESVLNKVSNLNLVNIFDLRAMDWAILQCPIRGSIASSLTITCTTLGGNRWLAASSGLALSSLQFFLKHSSTSIPSFKKFGNASICYKKQYPFLVLVYDRSCSTLSFGEKVSVMAAVHKTSQGKTEDENEYKYIVDLPQTSFTLREIQ